MTSRVERRKSRRRTEKKPPRVGCGRSGVIQTSVPLPTDTNLTNFGFSEPLGAHNLYSGPRMSGRGNTGSVTTHTELGLTVTDFFDYNVIDSGGSGVPQSVTNYFWGVDQNLFLNGTSVGPFTDNERTFCRPRRLEVFVLPAKGFEIGAGTGPNTNNAAAMFTVQAQVPGVSVSNPYTTAGGTTRALASDTQVTNVLPQIDTFWKKVLHCDFQKTFQSGVMRPYFVTTGGEGANDTMCLFQMSIVNPTTGSTYLFDDSNNLQIRVKVVIHVDQPIATVQNAQLAVFKNETFLFPSTAQNGPEFPGVSLSYVQTDLSRVLNNSR